MNSTLKTLKAALEAIRGTATNALSEIEQSQEEIFLSFVDGFELTRLWCCIKQQLAANESHRPIG